MVKVGKWLSGNWRLEDKGTQGKKIVGKHAKLQFMLVPNSIFPFFARPYANIPMATAPKWHLPLFLLRHLPKGLETVAVGTQLGAWWAAAGASTRGDEERGSYLAGVSSDPKKLSGWWF